MAILAVSEAHARARRGAGMQELEVVELLEALCSGAYQPEQAAEVLVLWSDRGETAVELAALVRFLLDKAVAIGDVGITLDLCGTGGSGLARFNVSTTAAFVLAAAGIPVAKHGNKGSGRPNGSFDLLEALKVPYLLPGASLVQLLGRSGVCFLFARAMHPLVKALAPARALARTRVARTIFNLAGPLANPCRPLKQVIGATDVRTAHVLADALTLLNGPREQARALVVCGHPGIDEVSTTGPTHVWDVHNGKVHHAIIERIHQPGLRHEQMPGGDAVENAQHFERLLTGAEQGPLLDMVCANAGAALDCWHGHPVRGDGPGFDQARALIANGSAWGTFTRHRELATELSGA
jgi:anthranilate phosphoribosyltransferase